MNNSYKRLSHFSATVLLVAVAGAPVQADDTEIFVGDLDKVINTKPNILFILDTSGSMRTNVTSQDAYDPNTVYDGPCTADRVYWKSGTGNPPTCDADKWVNRDKMYCNAAITAFSNSGQYVDRMAQYDYAYDERWESLRNANNNDGKLRPVECGADFGVHGDGVDETKLWPADGDADLKWGETERTPNWDTYTLYDYNYVNWYHHGESTTLTRMEVMQAVTKELLDSVNGVNVGLMRFSANTGKDNGGMVIHALEDVATARGAMQTKIDALLADGTTPLSEVLYEAGQYYMGRSVDYGVDSQILVAGNHIDTPSVDESRSDTDNSLYERPTVEECQKNFVVLLTDGLPYEDYGANAKIEGLPGFSEKVGATCDSNGTNNDWGKCLDDMAEYMFETDVDPDLDGMQNVTTYTIGFDVSHDVLKKAGARGGGEFFFANDTKTLASAMTSIVTEILQENTTFTAPAVSVNAFNRTQNLNDVYITTFRASGKARWPGNLKKYRIKDGKLSDVHGDPVVNPENGFFLDNVQSFWSSTRDGDDVSAGGAAEQLPLWSERKVYTDVAGPTLTAGGNAFATSNASITNELLGIEANPDIERDPLIEWTLGRDVGDENNNNSTADTRQAMSDPLHSKPVIVLYGGAAETPDLEDAVIYFATNEGMVHAVNAKTGEEYWSYLPSEVLGNLAQLYENEERADKLYGLDGNIRSYVTDENRNGVIDGGDKVYIFFGMRRGGGSYYAMDVTNRNSPKLLWKKSPGDMPGLGQSWSTPTPTTIDVGGTKKDILVIGGGYDVGQDFTLYSEDAVGGAVFFVDIATGDLVWSSKMKADIDGKMKNSVPSDIRVLDMTSDGLADRIYFGDMGARVWRMDIINGNAGANLVNGGVFASLGAADMEPPTTAESRRFYYAPDVALIAGDEDSPSYLHVGIGSGYRANPLNLFVKDRFYALRDYDIFNQRSQDDYDDETPIVEADLVDVTNDMTPTIPYGSRGWLMKLGELEAGEKVLAEARTFDNTILFTTFTPNGGVGNACVPAGGKNRLYAVNVADGSPPNNMDDPLDPEELRDERTQELAQGGISPEVVIIFPTPDEDDDDPTCEGDDCPCEGDDCPVCLVGLESCDVEFGNDPVRTFWIEQGADQ